MFTLQKLQAFYKIFYELDSRNFLNFTETYIFLEDVNEIADFRERRWDRSLENIMTSQRVITALMTPNERNQFELIRGLWRAAMNALDFKTIVHGCMNIDQCYRLIREANVEIILDFSNYLGPMSTLPLTFDEYSIFYRAGDFALSPTYFIDGLSAELWIFIWFFFFLFFLGLLISVKIYSEYLSHRKISVGDVAMYEMNFVTNQSHVMATNEHEKLLSWRIQMICQSVFNIIMTCAFSAFILALLSIKTTDVKFDSLEDFSSRRTHVICDYSFSPARDKFINIYTNDELKAEFRGIYNEEGCHKVLTEKTDQSICDANKSLAFVAPTHDFKETPFETCPIIELKNLFDRYYGAFMVRDDFKYREAVNRIFIQMRTNGVLQRLERIYKVNTLKKDYNIKREYKVYAEGVQFAHVRYIVFGYFCAILLALLIMLCENLHYRLKYGRIGRR